MRLAILVSGLLVFAAFAVAVRWHFSATAGDWRFGALAILSTVNMIVFARAAWRHARDQPRLVGALLLMWAGAGLFLWAQRASRAGRLRLIFEQHQGGGVLRSGPYRWIRHPFYASYIVFYGGCAVATLDPLNIAFVIVLVAVLTRAALAEEAGFAHSPEAADYAAYKRTAGLFWPKPIRD